MRGSLKRELLPERPQGNRSTHQPCAPSFKAKAAWGLEKAATVKAGGAAGAAGWGGGPAPGAAGEMGGAGGPSGAITPGETSPGRRPA
jgi:hypothetical protein